MDEPVPEPVVLTITAWSWVDEYEILSEDGTYATLPNAADWETLKSILPSAITAMVDGTEVEIPVQWECETFPTEGEGQGTYELKAILPEGYALGVSVSTLKLEVDLGVADMLDTWAYPTSKPTITWTGSGTEADPYIITTAQQLADLAWFVNNKNSSYYSKHYKLGNDIDISGGTWEPIGYYDGSSASQYASFKGTFDGNGKTISGLNSVSTTHKSAALFGYLENGTIKNLTVSGTYSSTAARSAGICARSTGSFYNCTNNVNITISISSGSAYAGGIAAYCTGNIENCQNNGNLNTIGEIYTGGICGSFGASQKQIANCTNTGAIQGNGTNGTGGICATLNNSAAVISNCTNTGNVSSKSYVGGIIGKANGKIEGCTNSGNVTASTDSAGGICGYNTTSSKSKGGIVNCSNSGTISGPKNIGGISGYGESLISKCYNTGTVKSTNTGSSAQVYVGGIEGLSYGAAINNCYNTGAVSGGSSTSWYVSGISGCLKSNATVSNCFNSGTISTGNSTYSKAIAYKSSGTIKNCYFLSGKGTDSNATSKNSTAFSDGTVARLLQAENLELVWGQTIGTDTHPVFYNGSNALGVDATGIIIDPTTATVGVGKTVTLTATVTPEHANDKTVTWTSDNNSIATVVNGVVTGVSKGTATITVTTKDGEYTATCAVTVCDHAGSTHTEYTTANCQHTYTCTECNLTLTDACTFDAATGICSVCDAYVAVVSVTVNGSTTHYKDIISAVEYVTNLSGSDAVEMKLTADSTSDATIFFPAKAITLDLNGKSATIKSLYYVSDADLTIKDSTSEQAGKLLITYQHSITEGAKLTLNSGFVEGNYQCNYVEGTFVMTGGTLKSTLNAIQVEDANSEIIISGGTLDGGLYAIYRQASYHTSKITLSGGYFINGIRSTSLSGYPLSGLLAEGYKFVDDDNNNVDATVDYLQENLRVVFDHKHEWEYSAEGATITATCANTDGACGDPEQSITIKAPSSGRGGLVFNNAVKAATISGTIEDVVLPEIVYTLKSTDEVATPFAPGVYVASITLGTATASCEFEIIKGSLSYADFAYDSATTVIYDGTSKSVTVTPVDTIAAYVGAVKVLYNNSDTPPTDVGSYAISISVAESDYYTEKTIMLRNGREAVTLTIAAKDIGDLTYDLEDSYPLIGGVATPDVTIQYNGMTLVKDIDYTLEYANNTTPGTATMTITGEGNYTGTKELQFNIPEHSHDWEYSADGDTITAICSNEDRSCPDTNGGSISIAVPDSVSYTGSAIEAKVTDNLTPEHTVVYSGDGLIEGKPVNPGTYTATITLGTAEISVTYIIENVLNSITVTADSTGSVAVPTKDNSTIVTLTAMADYSYGEDVDVTEDATWNLAENYTGVSIEGNVITLTPEAAAGTIKATATYGDKTGEIEITLTKANVGVLTALGEITGPDSISLSGKTEPQTGTYTITGEDIYGAAVPSAVTWSVTGHDGVTIGADGKLTVPVNVPNGTKLTVKATSNALSKTKEVTVISHVHSWTYSVNEAKDTITATCANGDSSCPNTAGGTVTISASNATYDGTAKTAALTAEPVGDLTNLSDLIQYQKKDGDTWNAATPTAPTDAGIYKASLTVDTDKIISAEYTVNQKELTIKADNQQITYGEVLDSTKITNTGLIDGHSITATLTPSTTNATTNGKITPSNAVIKNGDKDVTTNYAISYADGDLIINKANTSITYNGYAPGKTYDAQPLANPTEGELTISGAAYADVTFTWYKDSVDEANKLTAAPKDAGTYYVVASIAETANTEASSVTSNPITISKRDITGATITLGAALTYTGEEKNQTVTEIKVGDVVVDDYTISGNTGTNVGTYTLTVTGNGNFTGTATKTWSIGKAEPSYSTPTGLTATYGQTLAGIPLPTGWAWKASNTPVGDVNGNNTFPAIFTPGDTSNYSTVEVNLIVAVAPKEVTVSSITATNRAYNGTTVVALTGGVVNGVISGDTVSVDLSKAVANTADANVGNGKAVTITGVALDGADAANYTLTAQPTGVTVNITKASATAENGELTITNRLAKTYNVDLAELLPALETGKSYGDVSYTVAAYDLQGYNSAAPTITDDVLSVPVRSMNNSEEGSFGTITISFTTDNFTVSNATITVKRTNKATVTITGVTAASGLTYSGNAQAGYTGTPAVQGYTGTFDVIYTGTGNTTYGPSTTAPTNAGTYSVKITIPETHETLAGETTLNFTIAKAAVTITAEDKTAVEGDAKPAFTYTVTGLKGTDKLTTAPTMTCTVDMSKPGDYAITPSNAQAGDNYSIAYVAGKLTVKQKHNVKIADTTNGSVTTNVSKAAEGTEVAITVTPKSGYKLSTLTVKDAAGKSYVVSTDNNGKYYFTMPDADVTVTATFKKISTAKADPTNPKTGDDFQLVLWSSILCGSVLGVAILLTDNKKRIH